MIANRRAAEPDRLLQEQEHLECSRINGEFRREDTLRSATQFLQIAGVRTDTDYNTPEHHKC